MSKVVYRNKVLPTTNMQFAPPLMEALVAPVVQEVQSVKKEMDM